MIIRVFKATVPTELHNEFESKFRSISVPLVRQFEGLIGVEIGRPMKPNPEEFVMVSRWRSLEDLISFTGENWSEGHIPKEMEKFISACTVDHFEQIELS